MRISDWSSDVCSSDLTFEQYAKVAVKNHHHATFNPKAFVRRETPIEEVMSSEMIAYPNTKLMCSINIDGAAAAIVTNEAYARKHGLMGREVRVRGEADRKSTRLNSSH